MGLNGISSSSSQLAALLKNASQSSRKTKSTANSIYLNRTDTGENKPDKFLENISAKYDPKSHEELKSTSKSAHNAALKILASDKSDDDEFIASVKDFAECFNSTVNAISGTANTAAAETGSIMLSTARSYSAALKRAGIQVNSDSTITVDEDVVKKNITQAKSMFKGSYSFGGKAEKTISALQTIAEFEGAGLYNRYGIFSSK